MQATRLSTRCSFSRFLKLCNKLPDEKLEVVRDLQFGGLLNIKCKEIRHNICLWLIHHFNVGFKCIDISLTKDMILPLLMWGVSSASRQPDGFYKLHQPHLIIYSVHSTHVRIDSSTYLSGKSYVDASLTTHVRRYWRPPQR